MSGAMSESSRQDPEPSLGDLIGDLTTQFSDLVGSHINLAKAEIASEVRQAGKGAGLLGGGAFAALLAVLMLSMAAAWGLAELIEPGWAFLIVGLLWAAVAAALALAGRNKLEDVDPAPHRTMDELKEDQQWLKNPTS